MIINRLPSNKHRYRKNIFLKYLVQSFNVHLFNKINEMASNEKSYAFKNKTGLIVTWGSVLFTLAS